MAAGQDKLLHENRFTSEDLRYGRIEYKSKAEVLIPACNPVESLEEEFLVLSSNPPELEASNAALSAQLPTENVEYGTLGGGCLVKVANFTVF